MPLRIGIDARFVTHPQVGGFKTYTESLVTALADADRENEYVVYLDRPADDSSTLPRGANFTTRVVPGSLPLVGMPWREQIGLARQVRRDRLDLLHSPSLTAPLRLACPLVVTIHDMIWFRPEASTPARAASLRRRLMESYYRHVPRLAARRAAAIVAVSQASKKSIVEQIGVDPERIFVTHEAADGRFRRVGDTQVAAARQRHHLPEHYVLALGSADPRKNLDTLLDAYRLLPVTLQKTYELLIVWTHPLLAEEVTRKVDALGLAGRVRFIQRVSNDDLASIYNAATLFVFPSHSEGFGLPILEAMACGAPVVAANNTSIPEIAGNAALLCDSRDASAMASAMTRVLGDPTVHSDLVRLGLARAASFSWAKCAGETIEVYRHVAECQAAHRNAAAT